MNDNDFLKTGEVEIHMMPMREKDAYLVSVTFPIDAMLIKTSHWKNPMRTAVEAADYAVGELRVAVENQEIGKEKK